MSFAEYVEYLNKVLADNPHAAEWGMDNAPVPVFWPYGREVRMDADLNARELQ